MVARNTDATPEFQATLFAAEQGDSEAQFNLGYMHDEGVGVEEYNAEAVKWYRMSAEQGEAVAQYNLGRMYDKGEGVKEGNAQA